MRGGARGGGFVPAARGSVLTGCILSGLHGRSSGKADRGRVVSLLAGDSIRGTRRLFRSIRVVLYSAGRPVTGLLSMECAPRKITNASGRPTSTWTPPRHSRHFRHSKDGRGDRVELQPRCKLNIVSTGKSIPLRGLFGSEAAYRDVWSSYSPHVRHKFESPRDQEEGQRVCPGGPTCWRRGLGGGCV